MKVFGVDVCVSTYMRVSFGTTANPQASRVPIGANDRSVKKMIRPWTTGPLSLSVARKCFARQAQDSRQRAYSKAKPSS